MKSGDMVIVNQDLSRTKERFNLDGNGRMESMRGLCFKVQSTSSSSSARLFNENADRAFIFDQGDLTLTEQIDETKDPEPIPFKFDASKL